MNALLRLPLFVLLAAMIGASMMLPAAYASVNNNDELARIFLYSGLLVLVMAGLIGLALDVFSPNAMGRALDDDTVDRLQAEIVCGAANNQLAVEGPGGSADRLAERGILYAPDFVVNSGGVIQVADELQGFDFERARARTAGIYDTTLAVLREATARGVTTSEAANRLAEERIAAATPGGVWLPAGR